MENENYLADRHLEIVLEKAYIQEFFADASVTFDSAVAAILEGHPLPKDVTKKAFAQAVREEVERFNGQYDGWDNRDQLALPFD